MMLFRPREYVGFESESDLPALQPRECRQPSLHESRLRQALGRPGTPIRTESRAAGREHGGPAALAGRWQA